MIEFGNILLKKTYRILLKEVYCKVCRYLAVLLFKNYSMQKKIILQLAMYLANVLCSIKDILPLNSLQELLLACKFLLMEGWTG